MKKKQYSNSKDTKKDIYSDKSSNRSNFTFATCMNESLITGQDNSILDTSCKALLEESLITQKASSHFFNLNEELLAYILFSGYLNTYHVLTSVSASCRALAIMHKMYTRFLNLKAFSMKNVVLNNFLSRFHHLKCIDFSFSELGNKELFKNSVNPLSFHATSLVGLSLRGTNLYLDDLLNGTLSTLTNLKYLDLSKSNKSQTHQINDLRRLKTLTNLVWLNVSFTEILDVSVASLSENSPNIKYLSIECCAISDTSLISLKKLYLHTLNINGCKKITDKGFKELFDAENSNSVKSLRVLLCSFLPQLYRSTSLLVTAPSLQEIELRSTFVQQTDKEILSKKMKIAIFTHSDLLKYKEAPSIYTGVDFFDMITKL